MSLSGYWMKPFSVLIGTTASISTPQQLNNPLPLGNNKGVRSYTVLSSYDLLAQPGGTSGWISGYTLNSVDHNVHSTGVALPGVVTKVQASAKAVNSQATFLFIVDIFD